MPLVDESYQVSPFKIVKHVFKHMVPLFWGVSAIPFYMGWVFATRKLFPPYLFELLSGNNPSATQANEFGLFILGLIAMAPLLGGSTLVYNDYWDHEVDKTSLRKSSFPLPKGLLSRKTILFSSIFLMILALVVSYFVSILFMILVGSCIFLSIIYSTPPIRLKNRAGIDVLTNAFGSGLLCSVAGWIVAKPLLDYPAVWGLTSFLGVSSIYIPTTIIDSDNDKKFGVNTFAVKLGKKKAFYFGVLSIAGANILIISMGLSNYLLTPEFVIVAWPIALAQPVIYYLILRKLTFRSVYRTITAVAILLAAGNILMLTYYTGFWSIY
jgi:chlorophyll synthase